MDTLQLTVKRVVPETPNTVPQETPPASDEVGTVSINGPIASIVSQMLLQKYGHREGEVLAQESWELTAGDLTMKARDDADAPTPELWVYVLNGRNVTNAELLSAQEAFECAPANVPKLLVLEASVRSLNEHVESLVRYAHERHIPTKMTVSGGMYAIEQYFNQRVRAGV